MAGTVWVHYREVRHICDELILALPCFDAPRRSAHEVYVTGYFEIVALKNIIYL